MLSHSLQPNSKLNSRRNRLTGCFAADVAEKSSHLLHLHELPAGGAESVRLVNCGGGYKGSVIPEANRVCHGGVSLCEEVLKLVGLEEVGNGLVAAILGPTFALPPFVTHFQSALQNLH